MAAVIEALPRTHVEEKTYTGLSAWLTTVDHKKIGALYGISAFLFFIIGGIEALLIRTQLFFPDNTFLPAETYNEMFTMHGTTMIFLAIMPLSVAFFNFLVPLQIGARDVAFPRLNAFSYWVFLAGGLMLHISFLFHAAPDAGWFGYAPLTERPYAAGMNSDFWVLGLQVLGVASLAGAFNFLVTIINMRCPGMSMMRVPLFTWMTLVTSFLLVLAFPVITIAITELLFDRFVGTLFFHTQAGADPLLWQHLFWVFGHPEVYILILPAMGIVSEVLPTFSRKPLFGYPVVVYSGIAIAFMSFGVWAHHMFAVGLGPIADAIFSVNTMLIAVPTGVKIFNWIATMWGGSVRFTAAMKFSIGFIAMFIIGGLSGVMHASPPTDLQQTDSYFIVAHFHYVLFGGSIMGLFSGIYYWFPKLVGRKMHETLGTWHFWFTLIGFNLTFFPMHFSGMWGMMRRTYTYAPELGVEGLNQISTIGAFILAFGVFMFVVNVLWSVRHGESAGMDPWGGATLEWSIPSPPPEYNFREIPVIHSRAPLWEDEHSGVATTETTSSTAKVMFAGQELTETELPDDEPRVVVEEHAGGHGIHMPNPSYYPFLAALGLFIIFGGLMISWPVSVCGLALLLFAIYGWSYEPAS